MSGIRYVCLFDIDGTLLASGGAGKHAMYQALVTEFGVAELDDGVPFAGRTDRAIARDLFARHQVADTDANWIRFVRAYLDHLPSSLASRDGRVLPGVAELLGILAARSDVSLGLLTGNMRDGASAKLRFFQIESYFPYGGFGDVHLDRSDVAREVMTAVSSQVAPSTTPDRVWVIGDTPLDISCARAVGARVLAVCTGLHARHDLLPGEPDLLLEDLTDPSAFLSALA